MGILLHSWLGNRRIQMLKQDKIICIFPVFDQLDISLHLIYSVNIVAGEIICNAYDAGNRLVYLISDFLPKLINYQKLKIRLVVQESVEIEKSLIDHVLTGASLVFKDDRTVVFINTDTIHSAIGNNVFAF